MGFGIKHVLNVKDELEISFKFTKPLLNVMKGLTLKKWKYKHSLNKADAVPGW